MLVDNEDRYKAYDSDDEFLHADLLHLNKQIRDEEFSDKYQTDGGRIDTYCNLQTLLDILCKYK